MHGLSTIVRINRDALSNHRAAASPTPPSRQSQGRKSLPFIVRVDQPRPHLGFVIRDTQYFNPTDDHAHFAADPRSVDGFATLHECLSWIETHRDQLGPTLDTVIVPALREDEVARLAPVEGN